MGQGIDWARLFVPSVHPVEMIVRGTVTYLSLFVLLRVVLKRQTGMFGITDLLLIVLVADAVQNAMAGEYRSVTDGLVLVATLVFWNYALDWLAYRVRFLERFVFPAPIELVRDGRMLRRNMRREFITEAELMSQLREQGCDSLDGVKAAFMEGDGAISVIKRN